MANHAVVEEVRCDLQGGKREEIEGLARTIFFAEDVTAKGNEPGDRENVVVNRRRARRSETMQET